MEETTVVAGAVESVVTPTVEVPVEKVQKSCADLCRKLIGRFGLSAYLRESAKAVLSMATETEKKVRKIRVPKAEKPATEKTEGTVKAGRKPMYLEHAAEIATLTTTLGGTGAVKVLNDRGIGISLPTLLKIAKAAGVKLKQGRKPQPKPVEVPAVVAPVVPAAPVALVQNAVEVPVVAAPEPVIVAPVAEVVA